MAGAALAALLVPGWAPAAPRHTADVGDPTGSVSVQGWVEEDRGTLRHGAGVRVQPSPGNRDSVPLLRLAEALLPAPPQSLPSLSVEPPESTEGAQLPDLVPLPAWGVYMDESISAVAVGDQALATAQRRDPYAGSRRALRFGTTIANRGRHSLEIVGVPTPTGNAGEPIRIEASQCVRFAGPRVEGAERICQEYAQVGSLSLHPQHGHFHIDGFAQYRLLKDRGGKPDDSPSGVLTRSGKVGFCMGDTDWLGGGALVVDTGWYRECRHTTPNIPVTARQGVSPHWGDSYGPDLPGQFLLADKLPDGFYWIAITVNSGGPGAVAIHETNRANNTSYRRIQVTKRGGWVNVL